MKNYEKYKDKVNNCDGEYFCHDFVKPIILKADECDGKCPRCRLIQAIWLMEEYEEPEVDWSKVAVDTPILVRCSENEEWKKQQLERYLHAINKEANYNEEELANISKQLELLKETKESIEKRKKSRE